jgi:hypothetical protein
MIGFVLCGRGTDSGLILPGITTIDFSRHFVALSNCACRYLGAPSEFRIVPAQEQLHFHKLSSLVWGQWLVFGTSLATS